MKTKPEWEMSPLPLLYILPKIKWSGKCLEADTSNTCASNTMGEERVVTCSLTTPLCPENQIKRAQRKENLSASSNKYGVWNKTRYL